MTDLLLYFAPGSCARVALIALIETGATFETSLVRFAAGDHRAPAYRRLNPKSKVPVLVVDGAPLSENVAILTLLNRLFPTAGLMPPAPTALDAACHVADLCFCSATLHPIVTRIRVPAKIAAAGAARTVWEKGCEAMDEQFSLIEERLADRAWWYGEYWTALDAYLHWAFWRVEGAGFSVDAYPRFADHARRAAERPSFARAMTIEAAATAMLEADGLVQSSSPPFSR